jgi:serine phosphatase RsbU (regulator of sigma subunit)
LRAKNISCKEVGGDFYDVVDGDDGAVTAVIGDVSGKGVQAALLMSRVSSDFRRLPRGGSAQGLLELLNQATCEHTPDDSFATAVVVRLDASRRTLTVANAGHVRPLVRRANGTVEEAGATSGLPLGMLPGQSYLQEECAVGPGDIVLLMTDAVVEALDQDQDRLGSEGLRRIIANAPADAGEIHRRILVAVEDSLGSRHADDLTLLAIEIQG